MTTGAFEHERWGALVDVDAEAAIDWPAAAYVVYGRHGVHFRQWFPNVAEAAHWVEREDEADEVYVVEIGKRDAGWLWRRRAEDGSPFEGWERSPAALAERFRVLERTLNSEGVRS